MGAAVERAAGERTAAERIARVTTGAEATPELGARFPRIAAACAEGEIGDVLAGGGAPAGWR